MAKTLLSMFQLPRIFLNHLLSNLSNRTRHLSPNLYSGKAIVSPNNRSIRLYWAKRLQSVALLQLSINKSSFPVRLCRVYVAIIGRLGLLCGHSLRKHSLYSSHIRDIKTSKL